MTALDFTRPTARYSGLRKGFVGLWLAYTALLTYLSLVSTVPGAPEMSDKVMHFLAYGGLTGLMGLAFPTAKLWRIFLVASLVGICLEFGQAVLSVGRTASFADQIANMGGAALAVFCWLALVFITYKLKQAR